MTKKYYIYFAIPQMPKTPTMVDQLINLQDTV